MNNKPLTISLKYIVLGILIPPIVVFILKVTGLTIGSSSNYVGIVVTTFIIFLISAVQEAYKKGLDDSKKE